MNPITAVLLGAGARGRYAYAPYALEHAEELTFVAVAEPHKERRDAFAKQYGIAEDHVFESWEELMAQGKIADVMLICTQDCMHYAPTLQALEQGYHVLLEKPMSPNPQECLEMELAAAKHNRLLTICHVLRYTPFWSAMKRVLEEGAIGDIVSIQLNENVGYYHIAHSFVRGNWRNAALSSPMILAKSCHDMDLLSWLMDQPCERVSSFGSLMHFRAERAPEGAPERCTDGCPVEASCPYYAPRFYLEDQEGDWVRLITEDTSEEGVLTALREGPYGRCVYRCDNDVVDHQVVNMEFKNGATAMFSMCGFTHDCSRSIQVMGTHGEIRGYMEHNRMTVHRFASGESQEIHIEASAKGHGGGDAGIVRDFLRQLSQGAASSSLTSASASVQGHLMAFAAEESRLHGGKPIALSELRQRYAPSSDTLTSQ